MNSDCNVNTFHSCSTYMFCIQYSDIKKKKAAILKGILLMSLSCWIFGICYHTCAKPLFAQEAKEFQNSFSLPVWKTENQRTQI